MKSGWALARHVIVVLAALLLTYMFLVVHSKWAPIHRWNRAFADASLLLLAITMMIGPVARLRSAWNRIVPWRRAFGVHAMVFGAIHTLLVLDGWIAWELPRVLGLLVHPFRGDYVMAEHGFGLANVLGIVALTYGAILMATSNEYAVRTLGGSVWKFVQGGAYVFWILVVVHTAYFLFMHFLHFDRPLPDPNPLRWPFAGLVAMVAVLQSVATVRTWRLRRNDTLNAAGEHRNFVPSTGRLRSP